MIQQQRHAEGQRPIMWMWCRAAGPRQSRIRGIRRTVALRVHHWRRSDANYGCDYSTSTVIFKTVRYVLHLWFNITVQYEYYSTG